MTLRQALWKLVYPLTMLFTKQGWRGQMFVNQNNAAPNTSFHALSATTNDGERLNLATFRGKKVLIVNTASNCGYTNQYKELNELQKRFQQTLIVIAFPSDDFNQEKGTDEEIKQFCTDTYNISFPLMKKAHVLDRDQDPVYVWLTNSSQNGWNDAVPQWNFSKYLVNEDGILTHYFGTSISPLDNLILNAIQKK